MFPMTKCIRVEIASPADRDKIVAQIMVGREQLAEINQDTPDLQLEIYPRKDGKPWVLDFRATLQALAEGRQRLQGE
jgi:hypothetical protein